MVFWKDKHGKLVEEIEKSLIRWAKYIQEMYGIEEEETTQLMRTKKWKEDPKKNICWGRNYGSLKEEDKQRCDGTILRPIYNWHGDSDKVSSKEWMKGIKEENCELNDCRSEADLKEMGKWLEQVNNGWKDGWKQK